MNRQTRAWRLFYEAYDLAIQEWPADRHAETLSTSAGMTQVYSCGAVDGDPVILLHDGAATAASWHAVVKLLDTRYRLIAPDIIVDPGRSRPSRDHRTPEDLVDWLCGVMDALNIGRAHLVGESNGGWLAMEMALRKPERVRRIALAAPAAVFAPIALRFWLRVMPAALLPVPMTARLGLSAMCAGAVDFEHPCVRLLVRALVIRRGVATRPWLNCGARSNCNTACCAV